MVNTRQKMYETNSKVKKYLIDNKWDCIYFFPHLRFIKDYYLDDCGFDAIAWKYCTLHLIQIKTNCKPSKKEIEKYKILERKYDVVCLWIDRVKGKVNIYDSNHIFKR